MDSVRSAAESSPLVLHACAKINFTLEVLGRRPDGYHELRSVLQTIDLCDTLHFAASEAMSVECDVPELRGEDNLVYRAAALLRETTGTSLGATIRLEKRIPLAAGLGGGSSDAAATLLGLARLWSLRLSSAELLRLATRLGSDVPFFLHGGTALAEGRGERIRELPPLPPHWVVIARPDLQVTDKTRRLYVALQPQDCADGTASIELARLLERNAEQLHRSNAVGGDGSVRPAGVGGATSPQSASGSPGESASGLDPRLLVNSFERVARASFAEVERAWSAMLAAGAPWVHLAGSGPCVYTLVESQKSALDIAGRLGDRGIESHVARTLERT